MSDLSTSDGPSLGAPGGEAAAALAPAPEPVTQDVGAATQDVASDAPTDPWDDPAADTFQRSYVEKLRNENAERRTALQPYRDAFDGYEDSDRNTLLAFAQTLREDPTTAAQWMASQAEAILNGQEPNASPGGEPDGGFDADTPLTAGQLEQYLAQRDAHTQRTQQHEQQIASIIDEAKQLGYDPADPEASAEYVALLHIANTQTGADLKAAHEKLQARNQQVIDKYLQTKRDEAEGTATTPGQTGASRQEQAVPEGWGTDFRKHVLGMAGGS